MTEIVVVAKREKMSKSRGNGIGVDELVFGISWIAPGYEFRLVTGLVICHNQSSIWYNRPDDCMFYTAARFGREAAFLCECGQSAVPRLLIDGEEREQHPDHPGRETWDD